MTSPSYKQGGRARLVDTAYFWPAYFVFLFLLGGAFAWDISGVGCIAIISSVPLVIAIFLAGRHGRTFWFSFCVVAFVGCQVIGITSLTIAIVWRIVNLLR